MEWQRQRPAPAFPRHNTGIAQEALVSDFTYGCSIGGMQPAVPGAAPDPLEPGVTYRLLVEAGPLKLQDDFVPVAR